MARPVSFVMAVAKNIGKRIPHQAKKNVPFLCCFTPKNISFGGRGFKSISLDDSRRTLTTQLGPKNQFYQFPAAHLTNSACLKQNTPEVLVLASNLQCSVPNYYQRICALDSHSSNKHFRTFSTSSYMFYRSKKDRFDTSYLRSKASKYTKRINQFANKNNSNTIELIDDKKVQLKNTKLKINKRVRSIKSSLLVHNKKFRENFQVHKAKKNVLVRRLKRQLATTTKRENIKTIPNLLTTLRMASAPVLSYLVLSEYYGCAFSIFIIAGLSDLLDGYIARNFKNQRTAFGTALDPLADKFLISFLTVSMTMNGLIPVPVTVLILGRDAGLVIASFYIRYISLAPPRTLARYFDFSHVTAKIYPSNISKINTGLQLSYVAAALAAPVFGFVDSPWLQLLMYTTATTTFLSGADYMLTWRRRLKIIKNT